MSQNFNIGPKVKTRTYIQNLRHGSLQMNVFYLYVKFHGWEMIIRGDVLVQQMKVKKNAFQLLDHLILQTVYPCL